jgi:tRNA/rRNA methyltransferase
MLLKEELPVDGFKGIEAESSEKCWPPIALGLLFGSERFGMSNADVYRCHAALSIPTNPAFGSLNLAAAVQVIAYEWRQALAARGAGFAVRDPRAAERLADAAQVAGLLAHWESALVEIGFLDPASPKKLLPRLNQLFNRAALRDEEVHILRGVARAMLKKSVAERATPSAPTRDAGNG